MLFKDFTNTQIKKAFKDEGIKRTSTMSSDEYKRISSRLESYKTKPSLENKTLKKDPLHDVIYNYCVEKRDKDIIVVTMNGKHFSKNRVNAMSLRDKMRLKTLIKTSSTIFFLSNRNILKNICNKWEKVSIHYDIYNPKSRDTNSTDLKTFRDTFTINGLIKDDNRDVIPNLPTQTEIISKEYKIVATIRRINKESKFNDLITFNTNSLGKTLKEQVEEQATLLNLSIEEMISLSLQEFIKRRQDA